MKNQPSFTAETDDAPGLRAELSGPAVTIAFMLAGNAHVTFQSRRTGTRFTYRVRRAQARDGAAPVCFVAVLTGPDNYDYLGFIRHGSYVPGGRQSRIGADAPSAVAFAWVWKCLSAGKMHPELAVYHEGRCGRCGRRLTTPESVARGLGETCAGRSSR
jgi:hypothetical protein